MFGIINKLIFLFVFYIVHKNTIYGFVNLVFLFYLYFWLIYFILFLFMVNIFFS